MDKKTNTLLIVSITLVITNIITLYFLFGGNNITTNTKGEFGGIEKILGDIEKDSYFYQNLNTFSALFSDEDSKYFEDFGKKMQDEKFEEKKLILVYLASIFQRDSKIKEISEKIKNFYNKNKLSDTEKEELFSKNNDCAKLVDGIKNGLKDKYKNSSTTTESEGFGFIFYSPTLKTCVYSTDYDYSYSYGKEYYTKASKIVYNASVQTKIEEFSTSAYKHPYVNDEDTKRGRKLYSKFILENSGYNADLLKDSGYSFF